MSLIVARFRHHVKVLVGNQLEQFLSKQYWRGKGPAARLISIFSDAGKNNRRETQYSRCPHPIKKIGTELFLRR